VKKDLGMDVVTFLDFDEETYSGMFSFDEEWMASMSEEEEEAFHEAMPSYLHPEEWFSNYQNLLRRLFDCEKVYGGHAVVSDNGDVSYEVNLPYGLRRLL
jgi:hypothetical protein